MDIRCERCQTEYEFDEARLPEAGLPVKCTTCGHVFKVRRGMGAPAQGPVQLRRGGLVIATAPDLATVTQWIGERRLLPDDEFSQGGAPFRRLADGPELVRGFAPAPRPVAVPVQSDAAATLQNMAPVFAPSTAPTQPSAFRLPSGAQLPTQPATAQTMQYRVAAEPSGTPLYGSEMVAPLVPPPPPGATMQFRVPAAVSAAADAADAGVPPVAASPAGAMASTGFPVPPEPLGSTLQFRVPQAVAADPAPGATAQFLVGGMLPLATPAVPGPAAPTRLRDEGAVEPAPVAEALKFRVPMSSAAKAADAITNVMPVPNPAPLAVDPDAQSTLQFKVPALSRMPDGYPAADDAAPTVASTPVLRMPAAGATASMRAPSFEALRPSSEPARTEAFRLPAAPEPPERTPAPVRGEPARPLPHPVPGDREDDEAALAQTEPAPSRRVSEPDPEPEPPRRRAPQRAPVAEPEEDEEDPAILEFQAAGKRNQMIGLAVAGLLVVAAVVWLVVLPLLAGAGKPSEEALAELEKGRQAYLSDALDRFPVAEASYAKALELAGKAKFPALHGALSELHCAWAELLIDEQARLAGDAKEKAAASAPDAEAVAKKANAEAVEIKKQLQGAFDESKLAFDLDPAGLAGNRALVDYFRLSGDPKQLGQHLKAVEKAAAADPESKGHLAAAWSLDAGKLPAAETALADVVKAQPAFVRAGYWLALIRERKGDKAGAVEAMKALLARAPGHEGAKGWLGAAAKADEAARKKAAEEAARLDAETARADGDKVDAKTADAKAPEKKDEKPADKKGPAPAAIDTDKLIAQASKLLEKNKSDKALALCEQVLAVKPQNLDALYDKGVALFNMERIDDAIAAFKRALDVSPNFSDAMVVLAEAYKAKGQTKDALQWYRKYLEVMPNGEDAPAARANIQKLGGK